MRRSPLPPSLSCTFLRQTTAIRYPRSFPVVRRGLGSLLPPIQMVSYLRRPALPLPHLPCLVSSRIWPSRPLSTGALMEHKPGEIGMVSNIPQEHLRRKVTEGDAKHNKLPAIWFSVLSATRNGGYIPVANLNQKSNFFLSRRYVSTSVATDTTQRFKCQHETRGGLCKTLEKRNILDHKRRLLAYKYELRRKLYKAVCRDPDLPLDMRDKHRCKLSKLPRNSSFVRVRNRCIATGRPRAILRMFRMSRIVFREKASQGSLMGVKKSSW